MLVPFFFSRPRSACSALSCAFILLKYQTTPCRWKPLEWIDLHTILCIETAFLTWLNPRTNRGWRVCRKKVGIHQFSLEKAESATVLDHFFSSFKWIHFYLIWINYESLKKEYLDSRIYTPEQQEYPSPTHFLKALNSNRTKNHSCLLFINTLYFNKANKVGFKLW